MKQKKAVMIFSIILLMLVIPALVWAGAVPDTGQAKGYDDQGNETMTSPPVLCKDSDGNVVSCPRKFFESSYKLTDNSLKKLEDDGIGQDILTKLGTIKGKEYKTDTTSSGEVKFIEALKTALSVDAITEPNKSLYLKYAYLRGTEITYYDSDGKTAITFKSLSPKACYNKTTLEVIACPDKCYNKTQEVISCPTGDGDGDDDFYGQDANYSINAPSYTTLTYGGGEVSANWTMIKDNATNLVWVMKDSGGADPGKPNNAGNTYVWSKIDDDFIDSLNFSKFGSYSDWRQPTIKELGTIVNCSGVMPAINSNYFLNMESSNYWSATDSPADENSAYYLNFEDGTIGTEAKTEAYHVIAVRDGK